MTDPWVSLLSALVASVLTLVTGVVLFVLNRRHQAEIEEQRRVRKEGDASREAQAAAVARVLSAVALQPKDFVFAPIYGNGQALELLNACMALVTTIGGSHPHVAAWIMEQHSRALSARARFRRWCWLPRARHRSPAAIWGAELGALGSALTLWQIGERDDSWFAERRLPLDSAN